MQKKLNPMIKTQIVLLSTEDSSGQIYWVQSEKELQSKFLQQLGSDPDTVMFVNPKLEWGEAPFSNAEVITYLAGVTDNPGYSLKELIISTHEFNTAESESLQVLSGGIYWNQHPYYFNELIQKKVDVSKEELIAHGLSMPHSVHLEKDNSVQTFPFTTMTIESLEALSHEKKWALNKEELLSIKKYYQNEERDPTDVEIEIIAQTWSEHCKHKIFNATINYSSDYNGKKESFVIDSVYKTYIKGSTQKINRPWAVSVFSDNAGIVDWDKDHYLAIKVETHNSPSALDPYGGALTGILGVNRDIMGTGLGFKPIANTDVFCVGEYKENFPLPKKIIHPQKILHGIFKGVQDGGNKSGIPTVNGAMAFDPNFTGKPLVYCGTVGIAPKNSKGIDNKNKYHEKGDIIIMAGGLVGLDGIHGATMSSIALDESVPKTMVQIGDPFTQKKLLDFILYLRDEGLIRGITDNGAGGLSSSLGEMAEKTGGATIELSHVPLKYQGLAPWEIFVSESQERMSFGIDAKNLERVLHEAHLFGVKAQAIGEFTDSGLLEIYFRGESVAKLSLDFLHNGIPKMNLNAHWTGPLKEATTFKERVQKKTSKNIHEILKTIISDRNICSKEYFVKQYDHEVMAATIVKPFEGEHFDSPNDAGVIWTFPHGGEQKGVAIASGLQYHYSHLDTELMAKLSFDEAIRGVVAVGADPDFIAVTDNFCWPDPLPSEKNPDHLYKLAQLVRACRGLYDISLRYKMPMISGKDSMKNDFIEGDLKISCPATLLVTAMGHVNDLKKLRKSTIKKCDQEVFVYQLGLEFGTNYFGHFLGKYFQYTSYHEFNWNLEESLDLYRKIHHEMSLLQSVHDISEGGMLVALCESLFINKRGLHFESNFSIEELFSEYPSQFVVSVNASDKEKFESTFRSQFKLIGKATDDFTLHFKNGESPIHLSEIHSAWRQPW